MDGITRNDAEFIQKVEDTLERFVRRVLLKMQGDAVKLLRDNRKVGYTHELISNIRTEVTKQAGMILGVVGVGANVKHGIFVHEGTKPHFPPIEPILKWVIFKGLLNKNKSGAGNGSGLKSTKKAADVSSEAKQIAYLIARKISRSGTKAFPFLNMALNMNLNFIAAEVSKLKF